GKGRPGPGRRDGGLWAKSQNSRSRGRRNRDPDACYASPRPAAPGAEGNGGLNQGAVPGKTGLRGNPVLDPSPTLASQGIDKNLAHQARALGALSEEEFEAAVAAAHGRVARGRRKHDRQGEVEQGRGCPRGAQRKDTEAETKAARKVDKPKPRDNIGPDVEGQNLVLDYRSADGRAERFPGSRPNCFV